MRELGAEEAALLEIDAVNVVEAAHTDACSKASLIATDCTYTANTHLHIGIDGMYFFLTQLLSFRQGVSGLYSRL